MKKIAFTLLLIVLISCNKNDDTQDMRDEIVAQTCANVQEIDEVTISNVAFYSVETDTQYGFILKANFTNNTDVSIEGEPTFVLTINGVPTIQSGRGICGTIPANTICDYDNYLPEDRGTPLDDFTLHCFEYELE